MIYQFRCQKGHIFDVEYPMVEDLPSYLVCAQPGCTDSAVLVVTGGSGFILSGENWPGKEARNK